MALNFVGQTLPLLALVTVNGLLLASVALSVLCGLAFFRLFFSDLSDFLECIRYWFQPDIISFFRGEWGEDQWCTMKLFLFLVLSAAPGFAAYYQFPKWFPGFLHA